ncbi:trypsin-like serine protease [Schlesneria paludicola]|uniref:trypsin-like serine protease n=1 Tax=Schlesneria paludicola TaxID=360056 RepID=UPI0012FAD046|nr:trypsin-like serine protease [Schlesneria paludicola]
MWNARTIFAAAILLGAAASTNGWSGEPVEDLLAATFRLTDGEHSGTCFIVSVPAASATVPHKCVLATAAHVLDQMDADECDLILRSRTVDDCYVRKVVSIKIREGQRDLWTAHPDLDVAAMPIDLPADATVAPIPFELIADESQLINRTIRVGQETWISCFPAKLESNEAGWPVLRRGSIASHPLIPLKANKTILIDYKVFGGDSGAPIATIVNNRPLIVGVASSMQQQTDRSTLPFEERVMHTPMGLSIAVQSAYLRDTITQMQQK